MYSCEQSLAKWNVRWLFVKDTFIAYLRPDSGEIGCVMLMDQDFKISIGAKRIGAKNSCLVTNLSRKLLFKDWTKRKAQEWFDCIQNTMRTTASDFIQPNRYGSFAPVRCANQASWFVDGSGYMDAVADAIDSAKEEIFIADWWLSPEIYLKRPVVEGDRWRLDSLLKRKAVSTIYVYIQI